MSSSISGDWVYNAGMGADGHLGLTRLSLSDGKVVEGQRGRMAAYRVEHAGGARGDRSPSAIRPYGKNGIALFDFAGRKIVASWRDDKEATPFASSHALTKDHLVATTLRGELIVVRH